MALTVDGRTLELARKKVEETRQTTRDKLEFGQPHVIPDYASYRYEVGYLAGLAYLETAINEAREQANKEAGS